MAMAKKMISKKRSKIFIGLAIAGLFALISWLRTRKGSQFLVSKTGYTLESVMNPNTPRGIRNNNPLNIDDDGEAWEGLDSPRSDGRFLRFTSMVYGCRCALRTFNTYYNRGVKTLREIISTWAPPSENDTENYIKTVKSRWLDNFGDSIEDETVLDTDELHCKLGVCMSAVEEGFAYQVPIEVWRDAVKMEYI
jgi:hypothetical protein